MSYDLLARNEKIIQAIIEKADKVCPNSLAMIGIYGSFQRGDYYDYSDLDLMILINDDQGWQLGSTFIQDDLMVGHDLYCTTWNQLEGDTCYTHPNIAKLMNAKIVYCPDQKDLARLNQLRDKVHNILNAPFTMEDYKKAENYFKDAKRFYADTMMADTILGARNCTANVLYQLETAIAMLNKTYFKRGVKHTYEEINQMKKRPEHMEKLVDTVLASIDISELKSHLTELLKAVNKVFQDEKAKLEEAKEEPSKENLSGSYEEMYSNWKNKIYESARINSRPLAYNCIASLQDILDEMGSEINLPSYDVFDIYDPDDLLETAKAFEQTLERYRKQYDNVGLKAKHYRDIEKFLTDYLK